ncbi:MAG TPA: DUF454 domain-containing protein [Thiomicrospira sp.]|nr:DUF454 domain-containing protein [Thiomicrospira sp.]
MKKIVYITFGWVFVAIGTLGIFLPLLPTTVFMVVALALFSKSSSRFHNMLLNNRWIGEDLKHWQQNKCMLPKVKTKVMWILLLTFAVSILILTGKPLIQLMLIVISLSLLIFISRVQSCTPTKNIEKNEQ